MRQRRLNPTVRGTLFALALYGSGSGFAHAEDFHLFGSEQCSSTEVSPGGNCAASAAINSFIFLENKYPNIYKHMLTPNTVGPVGAQTDAIDTAAFTELYYGHRSKDRLGDYLAAKMNWFNSHAPGTTVFHWFYDGARDHNGNPTTEFLNTEEKHQEDVELFIKDLSDPTFGAHAITLTGFSCGADGCFINYQDPNDPGDPQRAKLTVTLSGALQFRGLPGTGGGHPDEVFRIYAAFSESPLYTLLPEPDAWATMLLGMGALGAVARRSRRKPVEPPAPARMY